MVWLYAATIGVVYVVVPVDKQILDSGLELKTPAVLVEGIRIMNSRSTAAAAVMFMKYKVSMCGKHVKVNEVKKIHKEIRVERIVSIHMQHILAHIILWLICSESFFESLSFVSSLRILTLVHARCLL